MLVATLILVVSLAALIQFAAFAWRAAFLAVATAELPENSPKSIDLNDFEDAQAYARLCPDLSIGRGSSLLSVQLYRRVLQVLSSIGEAILPPAAGWAQREMALCTRFATVTLAQRMGRNRAVAAELNSF